MGWPRFALVDVLNENRNNVVGRSLSSAARQHSPQPRSASSPPISLAHGDSYRRPGEHAERETLRNPRACLTVSPPHQPAAVSAPRPPVLALSWNQVKRLTSLVDLELVYVALTSAEIRLLTCLQRLVLSRVAKRAPEGSDVRAEAKSLLRSVDHWKKRPADADLRGVESATASRARDDSSRFPSTAYTAMWNRALAPHEGATGGRETAEDGDSVVGKLMHAAFAIDEIGGAANWRRVLGLLEDMRGSVDSAGAGGDVGGGRGGEGGGRDRRDDPELEEAVHLLKTHLPEDAAAGVTAEPDASGSKAAGSKLSQIVVLLEQHKQDCDESGDEFSALVLVSRRDLAAQLPEMLETVPSLKPFVKAEHVVGQSRMTPAGRRSALASFEWGQANVLVTTSACGNRIDAPPTSGPALVVCTSLPSSGTELAQLRGHIRNSGERTR